MEEVKKIDFNNNPPQKKSPNILMPVIVTVVVVLLGITTGYLLAPKNGSSSDGSANANRGKAIGSNDTKTFKDTATGVLQVGGMDGEGSYNLVRDGGPSQTVYLSSTVVDLEPFIGKKVQVWGETNSGRKAGWLMDVGKIQTIE